jgi:hypothetical protein
MTRSYGAKWCNQRMQVFNVFDPSFERDANPEGFRCGYRKVAPKVGATELGATAYDLPPRTVGVPVPPGSAIIRAKSNAYPTSTNRRPAFLL